MLVEALEEPPDNSTWRTTIEWAGSLVVTNLLKITSGSGGGDCYATQTSDVHRVAEIETLTMEVSY
jgi:hypothetical protein